MSRPEIVIVAASADNDVIGKDGRLPWHLPADLKHFKRITMGAPMIMGRKTFESLPGLLPGRAHIVLTRDKTWSAEGALAVHSVDEALAAVAGDRVSVIGGAEIFRLFWDLADRLETTRVWAEYDGDAFFPVVDQGDWVEAKREFHEAADGNPAFTIFSLVPYPDR